MEAGEVHQGVGGEEEVRSKNSDSVEVGQHDEAHGGPEYQEVSPEGVIVGVVTLLKETDAGVDVVLTNRLKE